MPSKSIWIIGLVLMLPVAAHAAAYKCTDANGKISFSDIPCPTSASKAEKFMERGAGYNPLTAEEKSEFKRGVMMSCRAPRNVCECFGDTLAGTLTYEELQQAMKDQNRNEQSSNLAEKSRKAMRACEAAESRR